MNDTGDAPTNFRSPPHTETCPLPHYTWQRRFNRQGPRQEGGTSPVEPSGVVRALAEGAGYVTPTCRNGSSGCESESSLHSAQSPRQKTQRHPPVTLGSTLKVRWPLPTTNGRRAAHLTMNLITSINTRFMGCRQALARGCNRSLSMF